MGVLCNRVQMYCVCLSVEVIFDESNLLSFNTRQYVTLH